MRNGVLGLGREVDFLEAGEKGEGRRSQLEGVFSHLEGVGRKLSSAQLSSSHAETEGSEAAVVVGGTSYGIERTAFELFN